MTQAFPQLQIATNWKLKTSDLIAKAKEKKRIKEQRVAQPTGRQQREHQRTREDDKRHGDTRPRKKVRGEEETKRRQNKQRTEDNEKQNGRATRNQRKPIDYNSPAANHFKRGGNPSH